MLRAKAGLGRGRGKKSDGDSGPRGQRTEYLIL